MDMRYLDEVFSFEAQIGKLETSVGWCDEEV
jgi:hypothetical protein